MDRLHDTRAPFWTGIGTGARARPVQAPNGRLRVSFCFWPYKETLPSSSLSFLAAKETLYLYPFSVVQTSTQSIKKKEQSAPKNWSAQTCGSEAGSSLDLQRLCGLDLERLCGGFVLVDLPMKGCKGRLSCRGSGSKVIVDNLEVCQGCRSRWSTCTSLFHTVGGSGRSTVRRKKERVVFRVGSCSEKIMSPSGAWRLFCGRPGVFCVLPSCSHVTIVSPPRRVQSWFGRSSCRPSTTFARCLTCQEMRTVYLDGVSVLSKTALLHSPAIIEFVAARMRACFSWNVLLLLECWRATPSVNTVDETDAEAFAGQIWLVYIPLERSVIGFTEHTVHSEIFPKLCLIIKEWFLTRFPPKFSGKIPHVLSKPRIYFLGSKDKTVSF